MIRLEMKNYNMILAEKQRKYQHYCQVKFRNKNILQAKKYYHMIKVEKQNQQSLHIFLSVKHLKNKQKQLEIKERKPEKNKEDIKSIEGLFAKEIRTSEIKNEIYEIRKLENLIKQEDLEYETNNSLENF